MAAPPEEVVLRCDFVPPSVNHYYGHRGHKVFITADGKQFRNRIREACAGKPKILGPVAVCVRVHWRTRRKHDLDNVFKSLLDSVKDVLFEDDDKVVQIFAEKRVGEPRDGFDLIVRSLPPPPPPKNTVAS